MAGYFKKFGKYAFVKGKMKPPKAYTNNKTLSSLTKYDKEFYQFAVIDPGTCSCAIRIERYYLKTGKRVLIWFAIVSFGKTTGDINEDMVESFALVKPFLRECHHIAVEHQLMKQEVIYQCFSVMMYYIGEFICSKGFNANLVEIDVRLKTTYIGGPTNSKQNGGVSIKKWSQEKALETCEEENDIVSYNVLKCSYAKAFEDLCDVKCYAIGWIKYVLENDLLTVPFNKKLLEKFL